MNPQLQNMAMTLGLDPALISTPQGVQMLEVMTTLAKQGLMQGAVPQGGPMPPGSPQALPQGPALPQSGRAELQRTSPYGVIQGG